LELDLEASSTWGRAVQASVPRLFESGTFRFAPPQPGFRYHKERGNGPLGRIVSMDKKRIERFKKQLLERRQELLKSIAQTQEEGRAMQHSYGPDEGDRANSSLDKELMFQQTTHARGLLGGIDSALARIADGTFGQCMVCEEEIGAKRLEALPWTRYCISCQESSEKNR
jgi:DnaK suppressor protein